MEAAPPPILNPPTPGQSYNPMQAQSKSPQGQVQKNNFQVQAFPFSYKILNNLEKRKREYNMIRNGFPGKIPIILEKDPKSNIPKCEKNKYLIPNNTTVSQFIIMIKQRTNFPNNDGFFLLANGRDLLDNNSDLSDIYKRYKDPEDSLLYIAYTNQIKPSKSYQNQYYSSNALGQAFLFKFKADYNNVEERKKECEKLFKQFPDKIPIICEKDPKSSKMNADKNKYLVPKDLTVSQFSIMIKNRIHLSKESSFFLLANGRNSLADDALISEIYERYKDPDDGLLYISYV